uniref:Methyltransferase domain-containing protein n=1 Tax=Leptocylindrus danicus TaxID=163516 RepID=A0A6U2NBJ7_9STRA|mmetsp:Transcript_2101/g.3085  ORF Transcript_2101/g.3085 Transcript_2101/m.3085 type:complete len:268 (+) Transcript_2101:104-907(+)
MPQPESSSCFASDLEVRLHAQTEKLEEVHLDAAIDAQLTVVTTPSTACVSLPSQEFSSGKKGSELPQNNGGNEMIGRSSPIFDDYTNPNAVGNCLSPFVPSKSERIMKFIEISGLKEGSSKEDTLLDIGCGDGRVCIIAAKETGCKALGIDVSPPCIRNANMIAKEENVCDLCAFLEADMTIHPDILLGASSVLSDRLKSCTIAFLYTYPTLLTKLIPILSELMKKGNLRTVGTLTYHLPSENADVAQKDEKHDIQIYSKVEATLVQ